MQSSWKQLMQDEHAAKTIFKNFFEIDPSAIASFQLENIRGLYNSYELKRIS